MATMAESVKESLIGATREPQLSQQAKATFDSNARRDKETGELFMTETEFVNAIAPPTEDYVSLATIQIPGHWTGAREYRLNYLEYMTDGICDYSTR